jgi:hypothetical protein
MMSGMIAFITIFASSSVIAGQAARKISARMDRSKVKMIISTPFEVLKKEMEYS